MKFEQFPENTATGMEFKRGWDLFVTTQHRPDVFWDPVDSRWEDYFRTKYAFTRVGLPQIPLGTDYWTERTILHDVLNIGGTTRLIDARIIWDPRDGYWYHWHQQTAPPPAPGPRVGVPGWLEQLNADLDALSMNTRLTPEERFQARQTLIQRAYGDH
ncbi:hypothetical protein [Streptomyces sp. NPDC057494]|uniref:hypothetical protein n=1 Tax=Streptomyces sp. NPDC057494 TaxID=3346148 RepID=UPI0036B1F190